MRTVFAILALTLVSAWAVLIPNLRVANTRPQADRPAQVALHVEQ